MVEPAGFTCPVAATVVSASVCPVDFIHLKSTLRFCFALTVLAPAALAQNVSIVSNLPGTWVDISSTGTALFLSHDGEEDIPSTIGNALLPAGVARVGSNGGAQFFTTALNLGFGNNAIPSSNAFLAERCLLPFWDDINTTSGVAGEIYRQETGGQLIVQWDNVSFYEANGPGSGTNTSLDTATFQLQVNPGSTPAAQFIYLSVDSARANTGGSATIGFQSEDETLNNTVEFSFNTPGSALNGTVRSILDGGAGSSIGTNYCTAIANSTGSIGTMSANGSTAAADNNVVLMASNLPTSQFGIFVTSETQGFMPGGNGNVCLGGLIGRYQSAAQILSSGASGEVSLRIDLAMVPAGGMVNMMMPGDTHNFQSWHRDGVGAGSNFTDGLSISFN